MTPRSALVLLLALAPLACASAYPLDDYAAESDSYALARDAAAGEDYFPSLTEPAEGEYEYERPPAPLPAIVYFAEAPSLAQAPAGPQPLGPSKLSNKVGEESLPPPARLVPALVLLLPSRAAPAPPRFQQQQALASRGPAPPFLASDADQEVPVPATDVRPPPMPESDSSAPAAGSDESDESDELKEPKEAAPSKASSAEEDEEKTTAVPPATTLAPPRARRSPGGGGAGGGSGSSSSSKSSASSSSGASGSSSFSSASSQASSSSFGAPIYFGGPTNSDSYASSSSQSNSQAGAGDAAGYGPGFGAGVPNFGAPAAGGYDNYGAGAAHNPQGAGVGYQGAQGSHGSQGGSAYGGEGNLLNRFGSLDEPGPSSVQQGGTSTGKGVHSSASSSIDSSGKVTYHVQAGKF